MPNRLNPRTSKSGAVRHCERTPPLEWRLIDRSLIYRWPPEAPVRCDVHYSLLASPTVALEVAVMQPRVKIS
jgi:hypothetical protein